MRILILPWLAISLSGQTALYEIKPSPDSRFALEIYKTGFMSGKKHLLLFERFAGALNYNSATPEASKLDLNVESPSFVVKDDWVSASQAKSIREEAAGKNGLEVNRFPQIRFVASSIAKSGDAFTVQGTLTIRGVDKPVTVRVSMKPEPAGGALRFEGKAEVKLKDYGIKPPTAALGAVGTKNEMAVSFSLIATPRR
jgi:polyisoprenoid-binding protein YceI